GDALQAPPEETGEELPGRAAEKAVGEEGVDALARDSEAGGRELRVVGEQGDVVADPEQFPCQIEGVEAAVDDESYFQDDGDRFGLLRTSPPRVRAPGRQAALRRGGRRARERPPASL